jgi:hypothetical protein
LRKDGTPDFSYELEAINGQLAGPLIVMRGRARLLRARIEVEPSLASGVQRSSGAPCSDTTMSVRTARCAAGSSPACRPERG